SRWHGPARSLLAAGQGDGRRPDRLHTRRPVDGPGCVAGKRGKPMSSATVHAHVAAWVGGTPVPIAEVDAQLDRLRAGPRAGLLPVADTAEGRQLRRWATQAVVTRHLLALEAAARGLAPAHHVEA